MPGPHIRLGDIATRTELAVALEVDVKALDLVKLLKRTCKTDGCNLPAVEGNRGGCILCNQKWFPRALDAEGNKSKYCRGYGLYGPQFMRLYGGKSYPPNPCCCDTPLCEAIGYSHEGMIRLPTKPTELEETLRVINIQSSERRKKLAEKPGNYRIAPWHYNRRHRFRGRKGWELRKMSEYCDDSGVSFSFPPPNGSLQQFIDEEIPQFGYSCGGNNDTLPPWVHEVARLQGEQAAPGHPSQSATEKQTHQTVTPRVADAPPEQPSDSSLPATEFSPIGIPHCKCETCKPLSLDTSYDAADAHEAQCEKCDTWGITRKRRFLTEVDQNDVDAGASALVQSPAKRDFSPGFPGLTPPGKLGTGNCNGNPFGLKLDMNSEDLWS